MSLNNPKEKNDRSCSAEAGLEASPEQRFIARIEAAHKELIRRQAEMERR